MEYLLNLNDASKAIKDEFHVNYISSSDTVIINPIVKKHYELTVTDCPTAITSNITSVTIYCKYIVTDKKGEIIEEKYDIPFSLTFDENESSTDDIILSGELTYERGKTLYSIIHLKSNKLSNLYKTKTSGLEVAFYDTSTNNIQVVNVDDWNYIETSLIEGGYDKPTPLGICVITEDEAKSHNDEFGASRFFGVENLKNNEGTNVLYWGNTNYNVQNINDIFVVNPTSGSSITFNESATSSSSKEFVLLPSSTSGGNYIKEVNGVYYCESTYLNIDKNKWGLGYDHVVEYPFNNAVEGSLLYSLDGKENTQVLKDLHTIDGDLNNVEYVTNDITSVNSAPAAAATYVYHPIGTNKGDWYLPSIGEIAYANYNNIGLCEKLKTIGQDAEIKIDIMSSNEKSSHSYYDINILFGDIGYSIKNYSQITNPDQYPVVRPFIQLKYDDVKCCWIPQ